MHKPVAVIHFLERYYTIVARGHSSKREMSPFSLCAWQGDAPRMEVCPRFR